MIASVILDTGPLLDLLLYRFWSDQGHPIDENRLLCRKRFNVSLEQLSRFWAIVRRSSLFLVFLLKSAALLGTNLDSRRGGREEWLYICSGESRSENSG